MLSQDTLLLLGAGWHVESGPCCRGKGKQETSHFTFKGQGNVRIAFQLKDRISKLIIYSPKEEKILLGKDKFKIKLYF